MSCVSMVHDGSLATCVTEARVPGFRQGFGIRCEGDRLPYNLGKWRKGVSFDLPAILPLSTLSW